MAVEMLSCYAKKKIKNKIIPEKDHLRNELSCFLIFLLFTCCLVRLLLLFAVRPTSVTFFKF